VDEQAERLIEAFGAPALPRMSGIATPESVRVVAAEGDSRETRIEVEYE
jgi:hypothetical protein